MKFFKVFYKYRWTVIIPVFFVSCEKEIKLEPENSEEKIFVEAIFTDLSPLSYVRLTKTKGLYEGVTNHPVVTDALVQIEDLTTGTIFDLNYNINDKKYYINAPGISGHRYRLKIDVEEQQITSTKTMSTAVNLNSVTSVPVSGTNDRYFLKMNFIDPPETQDFYLFLIMPVIPNPDDPDLQPRFTVRSDMLFDRIHNSMILDDEIFRVDEDWMILFYHIDIENYNYLHTILRAMKSLKNGAHPFYGLALGNPEDTVDGDKTFGFFITSPVRWTPIHIGN